MDSKRSAGMGVPILYLILISTLAYFEYGRTLDAALGGLLLAVLFEIATLVALIPFGGFVVYLFIINAVLEWFTAFTGFPSGLTVTVAFWLATIGAAIINIVITLLVILYLKRR